MDVVEAIVDLFTERGADACIGAPVSQLEHALQAAHLAVCASAADSLVAAALLHDVGHLLQSLSDDAGDTDDDWPHEQLATEWLSEHFGQHVIAPIQLHVAAKRYLCAIEPDYAERLSPSSWQGLALRGGAMTPYETMAFQQEWGWQDAVRLRRWDDAARISGLPVPALASYRTVLDRVVLERVRG